MNQNLYPFPFKRALELAYQAESLDEVPIGAVVVINNEIVGEGFNRVESTRDASMHAEMAALRHASQTLNNWRLEEATLYTTLEPCAMCLGAAILFRVKKVVWSCPDLRHGAICSVYKMLETTHPIHKIETCQDDNQELQEEIRNLLRSFFKKKR